MPDSKMTKGEREELSKLLRARARVAGRVVEQRAAELEADVEAQLLRIPGVGGARKGRHRLTVTVHTEALRPVAEIFEFPKPAQTVELLEAVARRRWS